MRAIEQIRADLEARERLAESSHTLRELAEWPNTSLGALIAANQDVRELVREVERLREERAQTSTLYVSLVCFNMELMAWVARTYRWDGMLPDEFDCYTKIGDNSTALLHQIGMSEESITRLEKAIKALYAAPPASAEKEAGE